MSLVTPELGLLFWMTIIFGLLFLILAKFGFPVITSMVEKRNAHIAKSLQEAKEVEERMAEMTVQTEKMIEEARLQQARMLREAENAKDSIIADARSQAREEAARMIEDARRQIDAEKESAMRDVRRQIALLSVGIAEKVLREKLSDTEADMNFAQHMVDEASQLPIDRK